MGNRIKRQHEPPRIVGDLLQSEMLEDEIAAITNRIRAIEEKAEKEDGPDFTPATPEVDVFNEAQLRDLFRIIADQLKAL